MGAVSLAKNLLFVHSFSPRRWAFRHFLSSVLTGGCGSQYRMLVVSPEFEGANMVKQQRMVFEVHHSELAPRILSVF